MTEGPCQGAETSERRRGKQSQKFVEQRYTAIELALSIVQVQESKAQEIVKKRRKSLTAATSDERKKSGGKRSGQEKLKEKKAIITAQKAKAKREKVKARKETKRADTGRKIQNQDGRQTAKTSKSEDPSRTARKRVSFA